MYYSYPGLLERLSVEQKRGERDELLICDIQAAVFYIEESLGDQIKDVEQMVSQLEISYDAAWALFIPNSLVYSHHTDTDQDIVLIVRNVTYRIRLNQTRYLEVVCDVIHDDGYAFGFARRVFEIDPYYGTRPIPSLVVYPLKYHDDMKSVYSRAVDMGKCLVQMPAHSFREISGRASRRVARRDLEPEVRLFQVVILSNS